DAVAMHVAATQHFENQHVERAWQQLAGFLRSHKRFRDDTAAGLLVKHAIRVLAMPASRTASSLMRDSIPGRALRRTHISIRQGFARCPQSDAFAGYRTARPTDH